MTEVDDFLAHYGVKGMKWGVRNSENSNVRGTASKPSYNERRKARIEALNNREMKNITVTTKNGETVEMKETKYGKLTTKVAALSKKNFEGAMSYSNFEISAGGEKVGDASFSKKSKDELYLQWLGVDDHARGKGYGSACFDAAVKYGQSEGVKKITLEVPGNAPDARHIYEKQGFVVTREATAREKKQDPVWGGLTNMELDLTKARLKHSDTLDEESDELELAFEQTFAGFDTEVEAALFDRDVEHSNVDAFLAHHGVKGMKWGVRKDRATASSTVGVVDPASAVAIGVMATVYGARGIDNAFQSGRVRSSVTRGKKFMTLNSEYWDKRPDFANKKYSAEEIFDKVIPGINPDYPGAGATMNCRRATLAYEMRRRGFDVEATKARAGRGQDVEGMTKASGFKGRERRQANANFHLSGGGENYIGPGGAKAIFATLDKQPERSRGELILNWRAPQPGIPGGAHSVAYEVINGKAHVFDTQSGAKYVDGSPVFMNTETASFTRLDNKDLNKKYLTRWMK
ncbi:acetyltransferase [Gordonia phage Secretariat]|uniref:Acetyltransferase n=1 Tax=Gordonia phage Secretariat TaxID=2725616 RepID=A0A6M3SUI1_9CAUD|nr:acetyltransferase [Gordonia phage Secretariat]QJD49593.1 acetyltransferase [Gordonia phage Secretariat]